MADKEQIQEIEHILDLVKGPDSKLKQVWNILRDYQKDVAANMIISHQRLGYLDMGMGKTLTSSFSALFVGAWPCIIVCPKSAMYVWEQELLKWFDEPSIVYVGTPKVREGLWKEFCNGKHKFIITNYSLVKEVGLRAGLVKVKATKSKGSSESGTTRTKFTPPPGTEPMLFGGLIADEIHNGGLFNRKTDTYGVFAQLAKSIPFRILLTGTPYRKGVIDFFGPLSIVAPNVFDSYWKFVNKWCVRIDSGFGKSIERNPSNAGAFREMIRCYADILRKEDHLKELPGKIRQQVPVIMDKEQARVYKELSEELMAETDSGELILSPSILSLLIRLRQILVSPKVLGLNTYGAATETMLDMADDLVDDGKPYVVFTPFRQAVPWIAQAIHERHPEIRVYSITGGLTPKEFHEAWDGFQKDKGCRVLICVIKSGASFQATAADTAFFLGYEFDFNANTQAEDRLNRMGQTELVKCYYFLSKNTIDDHAMRILNDKVAGADWVLSNEDAYRAMIAKKK